MCENDNTLNLVDNCPTGYQLNRTTGKCDDINECMSGQNTCMESQRCDNTLGSYACVR